MCQLQATFRLQTILIGRRIFGRRKYNLMEEHNLFEELKVDGD
jgi:hypothetical protein